MAVLSARIHVLAIMVLFLASAFVRRAIESSYEATIAMCAAAGLLSYIPSCSHYLNYVVAGVVLCVADIMELNIRTAVAIISGMAAIASYISNCTMLLISKISLKEIYLAVALLYTLIIVLFLAISTSVVAMDITCFVSTTMIAASTGIRAVLSPAVAILLYYMVAYIAIATYIVPAIGCAVMAALAGYMTITIPGTPLFWCLWAYIVYETIVVADRPTKLICAMGISTATGLCFAPCFTMVCWFVFFLFAEGLVHCTIACCMGAVAMLIYPWLVQKNWTLR